MTQHILHKRGEAAEPLALPSRRWPVLKRPLLLRYTPPSRSGGDPNRGSADGGNGPGPIEKPLPWKLAEPLGRPRGLPVAGKHDGGGRSNALHTGTKQERRELQKQNASKMALPDR